MLTNSFLPAALCIILFFRHGYAAPDARPDTVDHARALAQKAAALCELGRYEEATVFQKRALEIFEDLSSTHKVDFAAAHFNLAQIYVMQGRLTAAEYHVRSARQLAEEFGTPAERGHISILVAHIHFLARNYARAESELRAALPHLAQLDKATALNNLAMTRATLGEFGEARQLLDSCLVIREQAGAAGGPEHAQVLANLGLISFRQGDLSLSASLYGRAIPMFESAPRSSQAHLATALAEYGQVLRRCGRKSEAKAAERRARAILGDSLRVSAQTIDVRGFR